MRQGSRQWHNARKGRITGSRVGAILGHCEWKDRNDVMREMVRQHHGYPPEIDDNFVLAFGRKWENAALAAAEKELGGIIESVGLFVHEQHDWIAVSPDGMLTANAGVEVKAPWKRTIDRVISDRSYADQCLLSMNVCNVDFWYLLGFDYETGATDWKRFTRVDSDLWWNTHIEEIKDFRDEFNATIKTKKASKPHLEPLIEERYDDKWLYFARLYTEAKNKLAAAEAEVKRLHAKITEMADGKKCKGGGIFAFPIQKTGTDYAKIIEEHGIDVKKYQKQHDPYVTIRESEAYE